MQSNSLVLQMHPYQWDIPPRRLRFENLVWIFVLQFSPQNDEELMEGPSRVDSATKESPKFAQFLEKEIARNTKHDQSAEERDPKDIHED